MVDFSFISAGFLGTDDADKVFASPGSMLLLSNDEREELTVWAQWRTLPAGEDELLWITFGQIRLT